MTLNLYRTIFETAGTSTVILEEDAIISLVNNEGERLLGYSKDELEGKRRWIEFVVKDELDRLKEYHRLRRIDPDAVPRNYETRLYDKQGNIKHVMVTAAMIPGTTRSIVSLTDITEGKKLEKELKKRVKELEDFYDIAIGRELKMKELKGEIERLRRTLEKCQKP
jgi:PAS domain S-box-containing protein